jgi:hypothetical protein
MPVLLADARPRRCGSGGGAGANAFDHPGRI